MTTYPLFHHGEISVQEKLGVAESVARMSERMIRDHMPEQHRLFYQTLPMVFLGHQDIDGQVWASVLSNQPGFIRTPSDKKLVLTATPLAGDPLAESLTLFDKSIMTEFPVGLLGIELETKRRNRLSAVVSGTSSNQINLNVLQTFGNCPQYIHTRSREAVSVKKQTITKQFNRFGGEINQIIEQADTFFVASSAGRSIQNGVAYGADVSHRGGVPGFVRIEDDNSLLIPDFSGNKVFNTFGNFQINPAAGLLFIDFASGDVLTMTGNAEILWEHPLLPYFNGAERFWRFSLVTGLFLKQAFPWRFTLENHSPNNLSTGTWQQAESAATGRQMPE